MLPGARVTGACTRGGGTWHDRGHRRTQTGRSREGCERREGCECRERYERGRPGRVGAAAGGLSGGRLLGDDEVPARLRCRRPEAGLVLQVGRRRAAVEAHIRYATLQGVEPLGPADAARHAPGLRARRLQQRGPVQRVARHHDTRPRGHRPVGGLLRETLGGLRRLDRRRDSGVPARSGGAEDSPGPPGVPVPRPDDRHRLRRRQGLHRPRRCRPYPPGRQGPEGRRRFVRDRHLAPGRRAPDETALLRVAEQVLPTVPGWTAGG